MSLNNLHNLFFKQAADSKPGLWANINAKRKRGEAPAKPGSEDYPDAKSWQKVTSEKSAEDSPIKVKRNIKVKPEDEGESTAEELISGGAGPKYLDLLLSPWTHSRAGKATTVLKALGKDPGMAVTHPKSNDFLYTLGGGIGGLTLGAMAGAPGLGALLGAGGGSIASRIGTMNEIQRARKEYAKAINSGDSFDINAANPNLSRAGALLTLGGQHRAGSVDALEHIVGKPANPEGAGLTTARAISMIGLRHPAIPLNLNPVAHITGAAEGLSAAARNEKIMRELKNGAYKQASPAWQTSEGKNPEGGLNEKGRKSLKAEGHDIKRPQPEGGARKDSFCARMKGMKSKLTSEETANDPDSRINKSLRKWKCGSDNRFAFAYLTPMEKDAFMRKQAIGQYLSGIGSNLMNYYNQMHPAARSAVIGAGVGGIGNALFGNRRQGFLSRLATGGLAGGAIGGLGHLGYDYLTANPNEAAGAAVGGAGMVAAGAGAGQKPQQVPSATDNSTPPAYTPPPPQDAPPLNTVRKPQLGDRGGRV